MPCTRKVLDSTCWRTRSANGSAYHGIVPKYSLNEASSRSPDTKMISKDLHFAFARSYTFLSCGVYSLQGPHQCAEKYKPPTPVSANSEVATSEPPWSKVGP